MREPDIVNEVDLAVMMMGQHLTKYRSTGFTGNRDEQLDCLREVRLQLEACLGMLENIIPD